MKFLIFSLISLSIFAQQPTDIENSSLHDLIYKEVEEPNKKLSFSDKINNEQRDLKVILFRREIANLKIEIDALIEKYDEIDESCIDDLLLLRQAIHLRDLRIPTIVNQYKVEDYSRNFILNYQRAAKRNFYTYEKDLDKKTLYLKEMRIAHSFFDQVKIEEHTSKVLSVYKKIDSDILKISHELNALTEIEPPQKIAPKKPKEDKKYKKYIIDNASNCILEGYAIKKDGVIEEYDPSRRILVSHPKENNGKPFSSISPSEIDYFYKTLKFIVCEP